MLFLWIFVAYAVFVLLLLMVSFHSRRNPFTLLSPVSQLSHLPFQLFVLIILGMFVVGLPSIFSSASFIRTTDILPFVGKVSFGFDVIGLLFGFVFFVTVLLYVSRYVRYSHGVSSLRVLSPLMFLTFSGMLLFFSLNVYSFALGALFLSLSFVWRAFIGSGVVVWFVSMLFPLLSVSALFLVGTVMGSPSFMFQSSSVLVDASVVLAVSDYVYEFGVSVFGVSVLFVLTLHAVVFVGSSPRVVGFESLFVFRVLQVLLVVFVFIRFAILLPYSSLSLLLFASVVFVYLLYLFVSVLVYSDRGSFLSVPIVSLSLFSSVLYSYDYKYFMLLLFGSGILLFIFVGIFSRTSLFSRWYTLLIRPTVLYLTRFLPSSWLVLVDVVRVFWVSVLVLLTFFPFTYSLVSVAMGLFDSGSYVLVLLWFLFYVTVSVSMIRLVRVSVVSDEVVSSSDKPRVFPVVTSVDEVFWWSVLPWVVFVSSFFITEQYFQGIFSYVELGSYLDSKISFGNALSSLQRGFNGTIVISFAVTILVFLLNKKKSEQD